MGNQVSEKTRRHDIHGIKKADIILIVVCLLTAALLGIFFVVHRETGGTVCIRYDGIDLKKIDLYSAQTDPEAEAANGYYLITCRGDVVSVEYFRDKPEPKLPEETSYNLISVADGSVIMEAADCKDQICVRHKPISSTGESIICLPHRLVVEMIGDADTAVNDSDSIQAGPLDGVVR